MRSRLASLDNREFDVAIIGGGINGASAAQHAAAEGYRVILVDKADFGSGATSRSSRLLHCGLRYFEAPRPLRHFLRHPAQLAVAARMARQSMVARRDLVRSAGVRTRAMTFAFPIFKNGPFAPWQIDVAFKLLGSFAANDVPLDYHRLAPDQAVKNPLIAALARRDQLGSVATFTEYQLDWPERLCLDAALDAERMGATLRNYTRADLLAERNGTWELQLTDGISQGETARVRAKVVLNLAGIWIDQVIRGARSDAPRQTFGTKGANIVVQLPPECRNLGIATTNSLDEPFYCIPWHGRHYIGPTETPFDGDYDRVYADERDIAFLLEETNALLPGLKITRRDVVSTWAGVRPLTYDPAMPKGKRSRVLHDLAGIGLNRVFAMTAGPVMTYRSAGREVVARLKSLVTPSAAPQALCHEPRLFPEHTNSPPLLEDDPSVRLEHLKTSVTEQHARTLTDVLYRRTGLGWRRSFTDDEIARAAEAIAPALGWSRQESDSEIARFKAEVDRLFGRPGSREADHH